MKLEIVFKDGRKETFDNVASFNVTEEKVANKEFYGYDEKNANKKGQEYKVAKSPSEEKLFEVNPMGIDRNIFEGTREDKRQEITRKRIQEAFSEVDKNPEKYASSFYTLIPNWKDNYYNYRSYDEKLRTYVNELGGEVADWVEQALEWAQRISNGEKWESICNNADTANYYRFFVSKSGHCRVVGGSRIDSNNSPASRIYNGASCKTANCELAVPLVVIKK